MAARRQTGIAEPGLRHVRIESDLVAERVQFPRQIQDVKAPARGDRNPQRLGHGHLISLPGPRSRLAMLFPSQNRAVCGARVHARCTRLVHARPRSGSERIGRLSSSKYGRRLSLVEARGGRPIYRRGHLQAPIGRGVAGCEAPRAPALRDLQPQPVVREQARTLSRSSVRLEIQKYSEPSAKWQSCSSVFSATIARLMAGISIDRVVMRSRFHFTQKA